MPQTLEDGSFGYWWLHDEPVKTERLTERDWETLNDLRATCDSHLKQGYRDGWAAPLDCGGSNGSHHSYTLHKLAKCGVAERKKYARLRDKGSCTYRINDAGRAALKARAAA